MPRETESEYIQNHLVSTPPIDCDFKVGDVVTFTNDYGVVFDDCVIIGFSKPEDMLGARGCIHFSKEAYWFPNTPESIVLKHRPENIHEESSAASTLSM